MLCVVAMKDPMSVERSNLLSMMKLSIKVLIQSSLSLGRTLDSEYPPLQQFFIVLEHCLKHGLKGKVWAFWYNNLLDLFHYVLYVNEPISTYCFLNPVQWRNPLLDRINLSGVPWNWWKNCVLSLLILPPV